MPHTHGTVNEVTRGSKAHQRRLMMTLTLTGTVGCCCSSAFWVWLPMSARSSSSPGSITTT